LVSSDPQAVENITNHTTTCAHVITEIAIVLEGFTGVTQRWRTNERYQPASLRDSVTEVSVQP